MLEKEEELITTVMPTYARADLALERGEGAWVWAKDGRSYLDFGAGVAVTALGHCHPRLVAALTDQAHRIWHTSNLYRVSGQEQVAAKLVAKTFADTVFFCNSGAEANECAIKMARKYHYDGGNPQRNKIICATGAFHGRTLATVAAGGQEKHMKGFDPVMPGFVHVPYNDLAAVKAAIGPDTAAILVEPVQGEGGITVADQGYLQGLRHLTDQAGILLIFDEVQTGMGRTGTLFAHEQWGVTPDIMSSAKGLGSGFPVGACLATEQAARGMVAGAHGSTFGGNPLAMAVAEAVIDVMTEPGFLDHVAAVSRTLRLGLEQAVASYPAIIEQVRGLGLMLGLKCVIPNTDLMDRLRHNGLLTVGAGDNVVRLLPPLIIGEAEIDRALSILSQTLAEVAA